MLISIFLSSDNHFSMSNNKINSIKSHVFSVRKYYISFTNNSIQIIWSRLIYNQCISHANINSITCPWRRFSTPSFVFTPIIPIIKFNCILYYRFFRINRHKNTFWIKIIINISCRFICSYTLKTSISIIC